MAISKNSITNEEYEIPLTLDDSKGIENFIDQNPNKKVVVVQGLGFVGAVMSLVCANAISEDYAVIGVDLPSEESFWKIKSINEGNFPLVADDPKIEDFYRKAREQNNLYATYDPFAYSLADIIIVDINLDVQKRSDSQSNLLDFDVDLSGFSKAITSIGENCKDDVLIIVETTVPPGTCSKLVKPSLDDELTKRGLSKSRYKLGHSYERVMPGPNYIDSIRNFPRVYSGIDNKSADSIEDFLSTIINPDCELKRLNNTNSTEIAKVLENSYRATNISFVIEWSRFAEEAGVDLYEIVNAIRVRDTHSNLMYPGIGVGGYCLTKDPLLASWAKKNFFNSNESLDMSIKSVSKNDQMPIFAYNRLIEVFGSVEDKRITLLGVSYRGDIGDTRYSPVETLTKELKNAKAVISFHDPFVSYWHEFSEIIEQSLEKALENKIDILIISAAHSEYKSQEAIKMIMRHNPLKIFDTIGLFEANQINELETKHFVSVLGRGDIGN